MPLELLPLTLLALTFALLLSGYPVALVLTGVPLLFACLTGFAGFFDLGLLSALPSRLYGILTNELLIAIPLFVLMGTILDRSKVAADLIVAMGDLFRSVPGGLAVSLCLVGGLLAASTGIVGATVVTMGLIAFPTLLARGYSPRLSSGVICASGSLGQIIPPSIVLVLLGDQLGAVYGEAQRAVGNWAARPVTIADLFAGALLPGVLLMGAYAAYASLAAWRSKTDQPVEASEARTSRSATQLLTALVAPWFLLVAVLGSILGGIATPTEAAGLGACGASFLAGIRLGGKWRGLIAVGLASGLGAFLLSLAMREGMGGPGLITAGLSLVGIALFAVGLGAAVVTLQRAEVLVGALRQTLDITVMVYAILIGATCFALVFRGLEGDVIVQDFLETLPGGELGAIAFVMAVIFLLGFFLDVVEIITLVIPILALSLLKTVDPLWFGVLVAVNLQTSYLTPPFGFSLFYLRKVAPPSVATSDIYLGAVPFVILQLLVLGLLIAQPQLVTALPSYLNR